MKTKIKNVYYSIARDFGYSLKSIGILTNTNHATVLYGAKQVPKQSELKNKILTILNKH